MAYIQEYLASAHQVIDQINIGEIEKLVNLLIETRADNGRLFILGVGGSAANASHAVNDFRKLANIEAYAPTDNVSELTARTNDDGWATIFEGWLRVSRLQAGDMLLVFSVGGGNIEKNISPNLVQALRYGKRVGVKIGGIVGRDGGYTAQVADACVLVPIVNPQLVTPLTESFQAVIWHMIVTHPRIKSTEGKWESTK
jgi:D-sedoheptulose 7-phosphate isomerase